jgi:eukaryotic-like serine/threonine-protein kinase
MATKQELMVMALAVKQGLIAKEQVQECMDLQAAVEEQRGLEVPLVQIALRKKFLTPEQASNLTGGHVELQADGDRVSLEQARRIPVFEVHKEIGQGGMAAVFLATDKRKNIPCALKVLYPMHVSNEKFLRRFVREARLMQQFQCENIAKGHEHGVFGKDSPSPLYFMSMEFVDGLSVQDMLEQQGPFDEQKAIYVILEAAKGLAYMQEHGVVHRDVKPDNIMWAKDGRVLLVDLGFATPIRADRAGEFEDETCGTVQYISPEQAKGQADLDIRADIYSLGATLYHMVIGELPFTGKDSMEVMAKQVRDQLDQQHLKGGKISVHMHYFIEKMMSKDRDYRYQSAREVVDDITEMLEGVADLQYRPEEDESNPFRFGRNGKRGPGHSTSKFTPVSGGTASVRIRPNGQTVRLPASASTRATSSQLNPLRRSVSKVATETRPPAAKTVRMPQPRKNGDSDRQ